METLEKWQAEMERGFEAPAETQPETTTAESIALAEILSGSSTSRRQGVAMKPAEAREAARILLRQLKPGKIAAGELAFYWMPLHQLGEIAAALGYRMKFETPYSRESKDPEYPEYPVQQYLDFYWHNSRSHVTGFMDEDLATICGNAAEWLSKERP